MGASELKSRSGGGRGRLRQRGSTPGFPSSTCPCWASPCCSARSARSAPATGSTRSWWSSTSKTWSTATKRSAWSTSERWCGWRPGATSGRSRCATGCGLWPEAGTWDLVGVHDGARPLVTCEEIGRAVDALAADPSSGRGGAGHSQRRHRQDRRRRRPHHRALPTGGRSGGRRLRRSSAGRC